MARTKNNFLNAKPVSKMGGGSGGVRKPSKPYSKPSSTSGKPKLQSKPQKPAAKPTPKPAAPTVKGPVPRPGLQNRGGISAKDLLPNSARRGGNLPKAGAQALRRGTQGPKAPTASKPPQVVTKPVTRTGPVKGPVPPKGSSSVSLPNSRRAGVNLPQAGARAERTATRVADLKKASNSKPAPATPKPSAASRIGRGLVGKGSIAVMALGAANAADDARLTPAQRAKKYEVVNPDRGQNMLTKLQSGTLGKPNNSVKRDPNGRSSRGVNTPQGRTVATGSQQYNDYRNRQIADNRARLQGVGNPPKPKPPAPRQQPPAASAPAARPSASRPSQTRPSRTTATATGSQQTRPAEKQPSMGREAFDRSGKGKLGPNYGIDQFGDKNGIDMERRRAFLDAKDSQEGRKAINKLMEERRKKQRENDSTSK